MARKPKFDHLINLPFHAQPRSLRAIMTRRAAIARGPVELSYVPQVGPGADLRRNDCGPACVRMALDFLGRAPGVTIDQLAAQIDAADDGTSPQELVTLAQAHGAEAFVVNLNPGALPEPPVIALVRYSGFNRDSVQDKRYWDQSAQNPQLMHWAWWLGNATVNGKVFSVWNDPLYTGQGGKFILHSMDEFERAYVPYFGARVAIRFPGIFNPPAQPLTVTPRNADGVNFRRTPEVRPDNLIRFLPAGTQLHVLEDADGARVKLASGQSQFWVHVQAPDGQIGYAAAWLLREFVAPPSGITNIRIVLSRLAAVLLATPNGTPVWSVTDGVPLRVLDSNGPGWPALVGSGGAWLEVESYAFKRGYVRGDQVTLPSGTDARTPVDDGKLLFGDSAWLFGIHDDYGGRRAELFPNKRGWVLFTEDVGGNGASPVAAWASNPVAHGVLVRLNNGYNDGFRGPGTIPGPGGYDAFAQKCAGWVQRSMAGLGADTTATFIIGNEMNNPREWPNPNGDSHTLNMAAAISPQGYADCFNRVYRAIKAVAPNARVVPGAVDPYNALYMDCLHYFTQMLARIEALDGFAFHTYTHGPDVSRISSLQTFGNDPLRWQYYDFLSYATLMDHVPAKWRHVPVYLTETDQTPTDSMPNAWTGGRNGWVRAAYSEIQRWNAQPYAQQIQTLILYRFARGGGSDALYCLQDKPDILAEFRDTVASTDFRWRFGQIDAQAPRDVASRNRSAPSAPSPKPRKTARPATRRIATRTRKRKAVV